MFQWREKTKIIATLFYCTIVQYTMSVFLFVEESWLLRLVVYLNSSRSIGSVTENLVLYVLMNLLLQIGRTHARATTRINNFIEKAIVNISFGYRSIGIMCKSLDKGSSVLSYTVDEYSNFQTRFSWKRGFRRDKFVLHFSTYSRT